MYKSDLEQFANHVSEYREHNANVRRQFGECAASRAAYEKNKNSYLIHCKEFHMEDLPPPHVCVTMEQAMGNADLAAGKLKDSVKRLVDSQIELMKTEGRLQAAMLNSANVDKDVRKQHALNLQEQDLAVEFAKIQEEHKQLEVEKRTLSASGVKVPVSSVRATIRKK
jgi:DNA mismatch repair ATPase MutS